MVAAGFVKLSLLFNLYPETDIVLLKSAGNIFYLMLGNEIWFSSPTCHRSFAEEETVVGTLLPISEECATAIKEERNRNSEVFQIRP